MAEPKIYSRDQLKQYILEHLGAPVINIEITDSQLEHSIDDTLDDYLPRAYSGVIERYIPITLLEGINEYILPYDVFAVLGVHSVQTLGMGFSTTAQDPFSINQFIAADLYKPGTAKIDLIGYELINEMLETMNILFSKKISFDFNSISKILHIFAENTSEKQVMLQVYKKMDIQGTPVSAGASRYQEENIYNEKWIKRMSTARAQLQWGKNILKFQGSTLPNGGTLNGEFIYNEAKEQIMLLNEELTNEYQLPNDFFIG